MVSCLVMIIGIFVLALPIGVVGSNFSTLYTELLHLNAIKAVERIFKFDCLDSQSVADLFESLDSLKKGFLTKSEFIDGLRKTGVERFGENFHDEYAALYDEFDHDGDEHLDFNEFLIMCTKLQKTIAGLHDQGHGIAHTAAVNAAAAAGDEFSAAGAADRAVKGAANINATGSPCCMQDGKAQAEPNYPDSTSADSTDKCSRASESDYGFQAESRDSDTVASCGQPISGRNGSQAKSTLEHPRVSQSAEHPRGSQSALSCPVASRPDVDPFNSSNRLGSSAIDTTNINSGTDQADLTHATSLEYTSAFHQHVLRIRAEFEEECHELQREFDAKFEQHRRRMRGKLEQLLLGCE